MITLHALAAAGGLWALQELPAIVSTATPLIEAARWHYSHGTDPRETIRLIRPDGAEVTMRVGIGAMKRADDYVKFNKTQSRKQKDEP